MQPNIIGNNLASGLALFAISRAYKISWYRSRQPAIKIPILLHGQVDRSVEGLVKQRSYDPAPRLTMIDTKVVPTMPTLKPRTSTKAMGNAKNKR
jgi:hypothetical protein